ncbi:hypothetical protein R1sor_017888 [Riccia sorocarpa]|uniref:F-box domain-containing protein n=1 Tax=Riccia sorocarpa TaxID=122646 RepID=A0ABD3IC51_9MARC
MDTTQFWRVCIDIQNSMDQMSLGQVLCLSLWTILLCLGKIAAALKDMITIVQLQESGMRFTEESVASRDAAESSGEHEQQQSSPWGQEVIDGDEGEVLIPALPDELVTEVIWSSLQSASLPDLETLWSLRQVNKRWKEFIGRRTTLAERVSEERDALREMLILADGDY